MLQMVKERKQKLILDSFWFSHSTHRGKNCT